MSQIVEIFEFAGKTGGSQNLALALPRYPRAYSRTDFAVCGDFWR
jgi:hypothetical protein